MAAHVALQDVAFRYPTRPTRPVLNDINVEVRPNFGANTLDHIMLMGFIDKLWPIRGLCRTLRPWKIQSHLTLGAIL